MVARLRRGLLRIRGSDSPGARETVWTGSGVSFGAALGGISCLPHAIAPQCMHSYFKFSVWEGRLEDETLLQT